jgi:hypothetical protein
MVVAPHRIQPKRVWRACIHLVRTRGRRTRYSLISRRNQPLSSNLNQSIVMPDKNIVRAVALLCLTEWASQPNPGFSADDVGALINRHAPQGFTIEMRSHVFLVLIKSMRFIIETTNPYLLDPNSTRTLIAAGYKDKSPGQLLGGNVDVQA